MDFWDKVGDGVEDVMWVIGHIVAFAAFGGAFWFIFAVLGAAAKYAA